MSADKSDNKKKIKLCLGILSACVDNLEKEDLMMLGMVDTPYSTLYLADKDYCWRGSVTPEGAHPIPYKVDPRDIKEKAIDILTEIYNGETSKGKV